MEICGKVLSWKSDFGYVYFKMIEDKQKLQLSPGKRILILGPSGCGKSSLLKHIAGFDSGIPVEAPQSASAALLMQNPFYQIIMQDVREELSFPQKNAAVPPREAEANITGVTEILGIRRLLDREVATLSFGEVQLVMIAATFLTPADAYLLDEPSSHLDPPLIAALHRLAQNYAEKGKCICISSQIADEYRCCDEVWLMERGAVKEVLSREAFHRERLKRGILTEGDLIRRRLRELGGTQ